MGGEGIGAPGTTIVAVRQLLRSLRSRILLRGSAQTVSLCAPGRVPGGSLNRTVWLFLPRASFFWPSVTLSSLYAIAKGLTLPLSLTFVVTRTAPPSSRAVTFGTLMSLVGFATAGLARERRRAAARRARIPFRFMAARICHGRRSHIRGFPSRGV